MNKCPPNKIMNPKTKKCVLKSGKKGRQIIEKTRMSKTPNLRILQVKVTQKVKCLLDKIMNPKTKKCVLKSGRMSTNCRKIKPTTNPDNLKNIVI